MTLPRAHEGSDAEVITGHCYCGAIRFRAVARPRAVVYCHCEDCRRSAGAPVAAYAAFDDGAVVFEPNEGKCIRLSPRATRSFCPACGSSLTGRYAYLPGQVYIPIGVIDQAAALAPERHAHADHQLEWLRIADDLPREDGSAAAALNAKPETR